jgi:lysozyme
MRAIRLVLALATLIASCAPVEPTASSVEALTVCHDVVVEGIDVAEFQGTIDWSAVHASGREFAIARIGDGTYSDPTFATHWAGIRAAGMVRGAYLFFRPSVSAATQAAAIDDAVGVLGDGDLPVTIDVECMCPFSTPGHSCSVGGTGCVSPSEADAVLTDLIARVEASTGKTPMIYTGAWFWDGGTYLNGASSFPGNALWVSGYTSGCVTVPSGWGDWQFWQYSDGTCSGCVGGAVPGVEVGDSVDRNRWNGTLAELVSFASGGATPTPIYGASYVMQSFPLSSVGAVQIRAGETASAWIELRNSGTATWDENTRLATTVARDHADPFAGADWVSPDRPASVPAGMTIAPGESYRFAWTWSVPADMAPGMYHEHFGLVEEGVVWFSDPGQGGPADENIEGIIEVLPGVDSGVPPTPDAGTVGDGSIARDAASLGDGSATVRPLAGSCACRAGGSRSGASTLALAACVAMVLARRRAR